MLTDRLNALPIVVKQLPHEYFVLVTKGKETKKTLERDDSTAISARADRGNGALRALNS